MTPNHASRSQPPRWAETILRWVLRERDRETIPGDLLEHYQDVVLPAQGQFRANLWYVRQILSFANSVVLGVLLGVAFAGRQFRGYDILSLLARYGAAHHRILWPDVYDLGSDEFRRVSPIRPV